MSLAFQIVQAPMRMGLDEATEPHQVPFGTLTKAENVCWSKSGLLQTRSGAKKLPTSIVGGGSIAAGARLVTRGNELALIDGDSIYAQTSAGWVSRGKIPNIGITWTTMAVGLNTIRSADLAVAGSTIVQAWVSGEQTSDASNVLTYEVTDTSGAIITPPTVVAGVVPRDHFRVLSDGTNTWIVYAQVSGPTAGRVYVLPLGGTAVQVENTAITGVGATFALDAILIGSELVIAFTSSIGGIRLVNVSVTGTPTVVASAYAPGESSTKVASISLCGAASEPLFVAWGTSNNASGTDYVRYACVNLTTLASVLAMQTLYTSGGTFPILLPTISSVRFAASQALLCYSIASQDVGASFLYSNVVDSSGVVGNTGGSDRTFGVLSRPVNIGSRWLVTVANYTSEAGVFYTSGTVIPSSDVLVLDITPGPDRTGTPVQQGKIECLTGSFWGPGYFANVAGGYLATPFADAAPYGANGMVGKVLTGARRTKFTASGGADMWRAVPNSNDDAIAAGTLCVYDGERVRGYGFATSPLISNLFTSTSTSGGTIAAGNYLYNLTAERRSATGLLYRSPNATAKKLTTTGATSSNLIGVEASRLDYSTTNPGAFLGYRSIVNGTVVQRIALPPKKMTLLLSALGTTMGDSESDSAAGLAIRPALYTEGGELEDMQPPSALTLAMHQHRIWMVAGDGLTVWFSKDRTVNPEIAPGFHPSLSLVFDVPVVALAVLDDKLIAFASDRAWMILGQGPDSTGAQSTYEVVPIQTDVGCISARSVVSTPDGIVFQSARGIYLLTRSLEMRWLGRPVKDDLAAHSTITSAVLVASRNEVRFTCSNGSESIVLVYNYVEAQWTTSRYFGSTPIADACIWQGRWTALTTAGEVFYEVDTDSLDTSADGLTKTWVPETVETAWINATGPLTFQSVRNFSFEGVAKSAHSLTIDVGFDSEDAYSQSKTFAVSALGPESYDISIGIRRKCHAIRFRISTAAPAVMGGNDGTGLSLATLGIEVGAKRGLPKKPASLTG